MSDETKKSFSDPVALGVDRPRASRVEEQLLQGNWKVMYTIAKDGPPIDGSCGPSDGGSGGSSGSGSGCSDSGSSGGCSPG
jgi:hypothetical protein